MTPDPARHARHADDPVQVRLEALIALERRLVRRPPRVPPSPSPHAGAHAGRRRGRGMDYLESRAYQHGDDVRHLDWRLTARSGRPHTKVFQEEREHGVMLLVDCHAGMRFGTRGCFKSVQAARAAALLAWQTVHGGGRVGALAFGNCRGVQRAMPGRRGALAVCTALARWDAVRDQPPEPLTTAFGRLRPLLAGSRRVVLVSDGRSGDACTRATLAMWRRRVRLSVLLVTDVLETGLASPGVYPVEGASMRRVRLDLTGAPARQRFREAMGAPADELQAACRALGVPCRRLSTDADPLEAVMALAGHRP